jgi:L,D-transpeptidase ErfK/SrfK
MSPMIAMLLLFGAQLVGSEFTYAVQAHDTLTSIGARFGIDARVITEANGLKTTRLQPGQVVKIDNRHLVPDSGGVDIVVNLPQRMLFYFKDGELSQYHPVAAGKRSWQTPVGKFEILEAREDPVWHVPPSIQAEMAREGKPVLTSVPPSPENPLGKYWLGTSLPGIGIHGTNAPASIYSLQTHGCIRLHPDDIEKLFAAVDIGTTGKTIYQPVLIARIGNAVFLEVHPDVYGRGPDPARTIRSFAESNGILDALNWDLITDVIRKRDGIARDVSSSFSDHSVVEILNADQSHVYAVVLTIAISRKDESEHATFMFEKRGPDYPMALKSWFYSDERLGWEFIYGRTAESSPHR